MDDLQAAFDACVAELRIIASDKENPRLIYDNLEALAKELDAVQTAKAQLIAQYDARISFIEARANTLAYRAEHIDAVYDECAARRDSLYEQLEARKAARKLQPKVDKLADMQDYIAKLEAEIEALKQVPTA